MRCKYSIVYSYAKQLGWKDRPFCEKRLLNVINQATDILSAYLKVTQHLSQQFRHHFGQLNLTFPQALVLTVLGEEGPMPISELAERTGSANSTISGIVDRLEKLGLLKRERSNKDRRVIYVSSTAEYTAMRKKATTSVNGYFAGLIEKIDPTDRQEILIALGKLDSVLREEEKTGACRQKRL